MYKETVKTVIYIILQSRDEPYAPQNAIYYSTLNDLLILSFNLHKFFTFI